MISSLYPSQNHYLKNYNKLIVIIGDNQRIEFYGIQIFQKNYNQKRRGGSAAWSKRSLAIYKTINGRYIAQALVQLNWIFNNIKLLWIWVDFGLTFQIYR